MNVEVSETVVVANRRLRLSADGRIELWDRGRLPNGDWVQADWSLIENGDQPLIDSRHPWWGMLQADRVRRGLSQFE